MKLKDITVKLFSLLTTDEQLLDLMEVPYNIVQGKKKYEMSMLKKQFLEEKSPGDLVETDFTRLCVYELPTTKSKFSIIEQCYIQIDIYVNKKKNTRDRRTIMIADRLRELLHNAKLFDYTIRYYNRNPDREADNIEWTKYGVTFNYDNIFI